MVLVHMTGDERWLEPPYLPRRDIRLIPDPEAGVPREIQDEIRAAVVKLFANGTPQPVITDPGEELLLKMMRASDVDYSRTGLRAAFSGGGVPSSTLPTCQAAT